MDDPSNTASGATDPKKLAWAASFTGLQVPGIGSAAPPSLKLGLTKDERVKCATFFDAHVATALRPGGAAGMAEDYLAVMDGKPVAEADIVAALMALTAAGFSTANGGLANGPLYEGTREDVAGMVKTKLQSTAAEKAKAAGPVLAISGSSGVAATVSRADVQAALTDFFNKVMAAQKGKSMKIDEPVRAALQGLTHGLTGIMQGLAPPKDGTSVNPAQFAAEIAKKLPDPFPVANLGVLQSISPEPRETPNDSASDVLAKLVAAPVNAAVKLLPKAMQDAVRKGVADAIASGVAAGLGKVLDATTLDDDAKKAITSGVEGALRLKEHGPPMDRQQDGAGSPQAPVQPPPTQQPPVQPPTVQPADPKLDDPDVTKAPEVTF